MNCNAGKVISCITYFLYTQGAVRIIVEGHGSHLAVFHGDILGGNATHLVVGSRLPLNHGKVAHLVQRNGNQAILIGGECAKSITVGSDHLKQGPAQKGICPSFPLDDSQTGVHLLHRNISIVTEGRQLHLCGRIGITHIVLQITVLAFFGAHGVINTITVNLGRQVQLNTAVLALNTVCRIEDFELSAKAVPNIRSGQGGNIPVIHIHDPSPLGNRRRIGKAHGHSVIADPCLRSESEDLLLILLAVNGNRVSGGAIRDTVQIGLVNLIPHRTTAINILGCGQHLIGPNQLITGQGGIHLQIADIPTPDNVAPERHFGCVICLLLVLQTKFLKASCRIAVCDDTHDFGIAGLFRSGVLDGFSLGNRLGHPVFIGVNAVCGDLLDGSIFTDIVVVGVALALHFPVHHQIGKGITAAVNIHLTQCLLLSIGGKSRGDHAQGHHKGHKHGDKAFFHDIPP